MDKSQKNINIKESLSKLLFILKILNKRSFLSLILLLFYMLIGALIELIYLICISQFTNHLINNDITLRQTTNDPLIVNNFYAKINHITPTSITLNLLKLEKNKNDISFFDTGILITDKNGRSNLTSRKFWLLS